MKTIREAIAVLPSPAYVQNANCAELPVVHEQANGYVVAILDNKPFKWRVLHAESGVTIRSFKTKKRALEFIGNLSDGLVIRRTAVYWDRVDE